MTMIAFLILRRATACAIFRTGLMIDGPWAERGHGWSGIPTGGLRRADQNIAVVRSKTQKTANEPMA
jgi:hypothetical protein